jgi:hypothetical protein
MLSSRSAVSKRTFGWFAAWIAAELHTAAGPVPQTVPDQLRPPAGEVLVLRAHASGDQIYTCDGFQWTLSGPDARLSDEGGRETGRDFAGPTWQWSDGSRVTGRAVANASPDLGFC